MNMFWYARSVINKYQSHDPTDIFQSLGIKLFLVPMQGIRGIYKNIEGYPLVFVDENLPEQTQKFVMLHELGHHLMHAGENRVFLDRCTYLKTNKYEQEANLFAACFMYPFPQEYIYEGVTIQEVAKNTGLEESVATQYCQEYQKYYL